MQNNHEKRAVISFLTIVLCFSLLVAGCGISDFVNQSSTQSAVSIDSLNTTKQTDIISTVSTNTSELTIPQIAALTTDCVVEIATETVTSGNRIRQFVSEGAGSGVIVSSDGYIVTNNHVIEGAGKITVRLTNGDSCNATLVGRDTRTDIAILKITAKDLKAVTFGDSDTLLVGELAVAIGNPLGQLGGTVTEGIISALNRTITIDGEEMTLLQTTAAINPGNSGGALFNVKAELIGIVNAKSSGSDIEGLGFAIPINSVKDVIQKIITYGYVPGRIDLGAKLLDVSDEMTAVKYRLRELGVYISEVTNSSSFRSGDRIVSVDGRNVSTASEVNGILESHKVGDVMKFVVKRTDQTLELTITLKEAKS
jgi:serine protease Do